MADTYKETDTLKIGFTYADGDTNTISIPNPKETLNETTIKAAIKPLIDNKIIIGDKTGADPSFSHTAYRDEVTTVTLDLS